MVLYYTSDGTHLLVTYVNDTCVVLLLPFALLITLSVAEVLVLMTPRTLDSPYHHPQDAS